VLLQAKLAFPKKCRERLIPSINIVLGLVTKTKAVRPKVTWAYQEDLFLIQPKTNQVQVVLLHLIATPARHDLQSFYSRAKEAKTHLFLTALPRM
jgi:hypothetical protein